MEKIVLLIGLIIISGLLFYFATGSESIASTGHYATTSQY